MKKTVLLKDLAYARSGDKGDISDIGVMAFSHRNYEILRKALTPERIKAYFAGDVTGKVLVYELPNLDSLEVVMYGALGGGATRTTRLDQTGKSVGPVLLRMPLEIDDQPFDISPPPNMDTSLGVS